MLHALPAAAATRPQPRFDLHANRRQLGELYRLDCVKGQGERAVLAINTTTTGDSGGCGNDCFDTAGCVGFDHSPTTPFSNQCRMYGPNKPRTAGGPHNRQYCSMRYLPGSQRRRPRVRHAIPALRPDATEKPAQRRDNTVIPPNVFPFLGNGCIRVLTMPGSSQLPTVLQHLKEFGFYSRTIVQMEEKRDPDGGQAGNFRAHLKAWALTRQHHNCSHLMVLEDDVFFDRKLFSHCEPMVTKFLLGPRNGEPGQPTAYDMVLLGWRNSAVGVSYTFPPWVDTQCMANIEHWRGTHAYIISADAMERWRALYWSPGLAGDARKGRLGIDGPVTGLVDIHLAEAQSRGRYFAPCPGCAFQADHASAIDWGIGNAQAQLAKKWANPYHASMTEWKAVQQAVFAGGGKGSRDANLSRTCFHATLNANPAWNAPGSSRI